MNFQHILNSEIDNPSSNSSKYFEIKLIFLPLQSMKINPIFFDTFGSGHADNYDIYYETKSFGLRFFL